MLTKTPLSSVLSQRWRTGTCYDLCAADGTPLACCVGGWSKADHRALMERIAMEHNSHAALVGALTFALDRFNGRVHSEYCMSALSKMREALALATPNPEKE